MAATIFYSVDGELSVPEAPRENLGKYKPVAPGEPLCVEICRVSLGNTDDWMGDNEILCSSWAKTGGDAAPAPRLLNFYRDKLKPFESIVNLGAEHFGHTLVYYTPAYNGGLLRITLEVLEIDQAGDEIARFIGSLSRSLMGLPFFASQLPVLGALSMVPKIAEIGIGLYNLINKNDVVLHADLDLYHQRQFQTPLNPGRYVFVYDKVNPASFVKQYRLSSANELVDDAGRAVSRKGGLETPYAVLQITADERKDYVRFQPTSRQQEFLGPIIQRLEPKGLQQIADLVDEAVEGVSEFKVVGSLVRLQKDLLSAQGAGTRNKVQKLLNAELAKLKDREMKEVFAAAFKASAEEAKVAASPRLAVSGRPAGERRDKARRVREVLAQISGPFSAQHLAEQCKGVSLGWIRKLLRRLGKQGVVRKLGAGPTVQWERTERPVLVG